MMGFWAVVCAIACALTLWSQHHQKTAFSDGFKIFASLCFFLPAVWSAITGQQDHFTVIMTFGFGLSLIGDILLLKTTSKRWFLLGLAAFLTAHLAYATAFINTGVKHHEFVSTSVVVMAAMIGCYVWLYRHLKKRMKSAVAVYLIAIGLMLITAIITRHPAQHLIVTGAVLFALSDIFVARQRFVSPGFHNRLIGLPLYYAGQLFLLSALLSA